MWYAMIFCSCYVWICGCGVFCCLFEYYFVDGYYDEFGDYGWVGDNGGGVECYGYFVDFECSVDRSFVDYGCGEFEQELHCFG